jgi:hypothetical protein
VWGLWFKTYSLKKTNQRRRADVPSVAQTDCCSVWLANYWSVVTTKTQSHREADDKAATLSAAICAVGPFTGFLATTKADGTFPLLPPLGLANVKTNTNLCDKERWSRVQRPRTLSDQAPVAYLAGRSITTALCTLRGLASNRAALTLSPLIDAALVAGALTVHLLGMWRCSFFRSVRVRVETPPGQWGPSRPFSISWYSINANSKH